MQTIDWQRAHEELVRLSQVRAALDGEEGRWLLAARRADTHARLGHGSFCEYIERLFGYRPRWTREKLRVAEALERLPETAAALERGDVSWSVVRELSRVATRETESAWLASARGRTLRDVEARVSGRRPGDGPEAPGDPQALRHMLRFEVSAETLAAFRDAMDVLRRDAGGGLDDDDALLLMARRVIAGAAGERGDAGRSRYQVRLDVCERCRAGVLQAGGEPIPVEPEQVELAMCDAQVIAAGAVTHGGHIAADTVTHGGHAGPGRPTPTPTRATQTVPPAVRREVVRRDGGRCAVPGCRHSAFVDLHHLELRSEGGTHDPDQMLVACGAHHRAIHHGELLVTGRVASGLLFRHADGRVYGSGVSASRADVFARAFSALRNLGFREREVREVLDLLRNESPRAGTGATPSIEAIVRQALDRLTPRSVA